MIKFALPIRRLACQMETIWRPVSLCTWPAAGRCFPAVAVVAVVTAAAEEVLVVAVVEVMTADKMTKQKGQGQGKVRLAHLTKEKAWYGLVWAWCGLAWAWFYLWWASESVL